MMLRLPLMLSLGTITAAAEDAAAPKVISSSKHLTIVCSSFLLCQCALSDEFGR